MLCPLALLCIDVLFETYAWLIEFKDHCVTALFISGLVGGPANLHGAQKL